MSQYTIVTDLNRCVGCLGCAVACKAFNAVPVGSYWNKVKRVGPTKVGETYNISDVQMYYLVMQCQHCENPECVTVCPTGASVKAEDGTVQIDAETCIGCGACLNACPYSVRYIDIDTGVAQKCTMCASKIADGELPQCVSQCTGIARFAGDIDEGIENLKGACGYTLGENVEPFTEDEIHTVPDSGNGPSMRYILRRMEWQDLGDCDFTRM